jgi:predicted metal-binding membrane protein
MLALTGMWLAMMTAMMTPVAAPWVLAFNRLQSRDLVRRRHAIVSTAVFSAGYLVAWLAYSIGAAIVQRVLLSFGLLDARHPWSSVAAAGILVGAGLYQFAPLKHACLTHCRNPLTYFLTRWRSGPASGFRLGLSHGLFCVGCCWAIMATSLAVGLSSPVWMLVLTAVVFVEQVVPLGQHLRVPLGTALIVAGLLHF